MQKGVHRRGRGRAGTGWEGTQDGGGSRETGLKGQKPQRGVGRACGWRSLWGLSTRPQPCRQWGATFLKGFGSELALGAGPAEGQEGAEGSLNPAWVGSRMGGQILPGFLWSPPPAPEAPQAHHPWEASLGCHRCHSQNC